MHAWARGALIEQAGRRSFHPEDIAEYERKLSGITRVRDHVARPPGYVHIARAVLMCAVSSFSKPYRTVRYDNSHTVTVRHRTYGTSAHTVVPVRLL